jgi:putative iron-dependent peroxidase
MSTPQPGIFALGNAAHAYLELDLIAGADARRLVEVLATLQATQATGGGVNLVVGFRPELWRGIAPAQVPGELRGFTAPVHGIEGFVMPATQHDAVMWLAGGAYEIVFDAIVAALRALHGIASVADEIAGWSYRHNRDLTGFEDGTENPKLADAPAAALVPEGEAGAGGSVLLLQKWRHLAEQWNALPDAEQEKVIGRTKPDSVELDPRPESSHVKRTDQDDFGDMFRRNMAYGTASDHGTMFVGFCARRAPLADMLDSMAGLKNGVRDALTRFSTPLTGAYYWVPATEALHPHAQRADD